MIDQKVQCGALFTLPAIVKEFLCAMQNSTTLEEAERLAVRYLNVQTSVAKFNLHMGARESRFELNFNLPNTRPGSLRQMEDFTQGFTHRQMRMLAGDNYKLIRVELRHPHCATSRSIGIFSVLRLSSACLIAA
ncbi:MAG: AraC family transcriptional regulator [Gammaproteobacteria bacterium]|nr:AraC family transcriptional regulator [Gammaproteobacteria bacterium]